MQKRRTHETTECTEKNPVFSKNISPLTLSPPSGERVEVRGVGKKQEEIPWKKKLQSQLMECHVSTV
jgi:hypothetical protein